MFYTSAGILIVISQFILLLLILYITVYDKKKENKVDDLIEGIDGVSSVTINTKRYIELIKTEDDLRELLLKMKEVENEG